MSFLCSSSFEMLCCRMNQMKTSWCAMCRRTFIYIYRLQLRWPKLGLATVQYIPSQSFTWIFVGLNCYYLSITWGKKSWACQSSLCMLDNKWKPTCNADQPADSSTWQSLTSTGLQECREWKSETAEATHEEAHWSDDEHGSTVTWKSWVYRITSEICRRYMQKMLLQCCSLEVLISDKPIVWFRGAELHRAEWSATSADHDHQVGPSLKK